MTETIYTFGNRLRYWRRYLDYTQKELQSKSGISDTTISRYEREHIRPSLDTVKRLASALGVRVSDLTGD